MMLVLFSCSQPVPGQLLCIAAVQKRVWCCSVSSWSLPQWFVTRLPCPADIESLPVSLANLVYGEKPASVACMVTVLSNR
jgi:hypothetical protein